MYCPAFEGRKKNPMTLAFASIKNLIIPIPF